MYSLKFPFIHMNLDCEFFKFFVGCHCHLSWRRQLNIINVLKAAIITRKYDFFLRDKDLPSKSTDILTELLKHSFLPADFGVLTILVILRILITFLYEYFNYITKNSNKNVPFTWCKNWDDFLGAYLSSARFWPPPVSLPLVVMIGFFLQILFHLIVSLFFYASSFIEIVASTSLVFIVGRSKSVQRLISFTSLLSPTPSFGIME